MAGARHRSSGKRRQAADRVPAPFKSHKRRRQASLASPHAGGHQLGTKGRLPTRSASGIPRSRKREPPDWLLGGGRVSLSYARVDSIHIRAMPRSLFATLLSGSFALQLLLGGVGPACGVAGGTHVHPGVASAVRPLPHEADEASDASAHQHARRPASGGALPLSCDQQANAASCDVVMSCSVTFVAAAGADSPSAAPGTAAVHVAAVLEPHSRSQAPEPPPPRA
jgi:hypothetical protein